MLCIFKHLWRHHMTSHFYDFRASRWLTEPPSSGKFSSTSLGGGGKGSTCPLGLTSPLVNKSCVWPCMYYLHYVYYCTQPNLCIQKNTSNSTAAAILYLHSSCFSTYNCPFFVFVYPLTKVCHVQDCIWDSTQYWKVLYLLPLIFVKVNWFVLAICCFWYVAM